MKSAHTYARAAVRLTVAAAVLAGCVLADCAVLAYDLGRLTGEAVHARNDQLAALAVRLLAPAPAPAPVATVEPEPEPTPAFIQTPHAFTVPALEGGADLRAFGSRQTALDQRSHWERPTYAQQRGWEPRAPRVAGPVGELAWCWISAPAPAPAPVTASIAPEPGAPSLAQIADCRRRMVRLERMTVAQLRDLTGARSKRLRKADLVQIALESAMA
jgi:hypothetical protein